ncbi:uncharacterized protein F4817DRAFT_369596 [Daldinia loculata]|uniref:uncharacterized protein n=1 Tax=Daldinia loculata TaxID=103429 RepID=UPI0020C48A4A|nr:uncharacterized protein F4817DRAFT_369596 [Daldinia loculata]KAI1642267.1 hypothetical protein F4817DRAFT_369596 [Daldinia loculata]
MASPDNDQSLPQQSHHWSANYHGSRASKRNYSEEIAEEQNCSVWITYLPAGCDSTMLCHSLRGTGKIYSMFINPPNDQHRTSAAKVVFWDHRGVDKLIQMAESRQFRVGPNRPRVTPHRIKVSAQVPSRRSRVIEISGPMEIVNRDFLSAFFLERFWFDIESVQTIGIYGGISTMKWSFCCYRCQSQSAVWCIFDQKHRQTLTDSERRSWSQVYVRWLEDPCA